MIIGIVWSMSNSKNFMTLKHVYKNKKKYFFFSSAKNIFLHWDYDQNYLSM